MPRNVRRPPSAISGAFRRRPSRRPFVRRRIPLRRRLPVRRFNRRRTR